MNRTQAVLRVRDDGIIPCCRIAVLASTGARAAVVCGRESGHDGPHHDQAIDVEWVDRA